MTHSEVKHVLEAPSTISRQLILSLALLAALLCSSMAEGRDEADSVIAGSPSTVKFIRDPELPNCSSALVRGDPAKGPFTWLDKSDGDCFVPMHWHNQGEIIIVVSGTAEIEVKNHPFVILRDGGYYYQPPVLIQNLNPDVLMMQPAEDSYRCDAAKLLSSSKIWSIFIQ